MTGRDRGSRSRPRGPLDVACADCDAAVGVPCLIEPDVHDSRIRALDGDEWADDWTAGAIDADGDGVPGALDADDPSNRW